MKVGSKVVFLLRDSEGFGEAISAAFRPNPSNSTVEESFELSLERYGIQNCKASGILRHFLDHQGLYEVPLLSLPLSLMVLFRTQKRVCIRIDSMWDLGVEKWVVYFLMECALVFMVKVKFVAIWGLDCV
ncbi:uncharacterized protein LOC126609735 [Malus sylvestris]|uniref:uncharacterized protein LOC126609735 n=1 Tax=Malus sylvestris TaxID=3752 RepID=UPI0021ABB592|nr:uncharacterized protein LOC126609735 [Malus sylvestris]